MKAHTTYLTFKTEERREFVRITEDVQAAVEEAGIEEGMALVSAMHITAGVWVNDDEPGIQEDVLEWLDKLAPPSWRDPANETATSLRPDPGDYRHHRGGEDNGDAHLKNLLVPSSGDRAGDRGGTRPRPMAADLLHGVRRPPLEAAGDKGVRKLVRHSGRRRSGASRASCISNCDRSV
jgi:thiamine phosphate synthase YjbQ (UPF0047 family)